jgi:cytidyltransferase-like protein
MRQIVITGSFDDLRSRGVRFLEEASKLGQVNALLWSDETVLAQTGHKPKFPLTEREYFLQAIRYVSRVWTVEGPAQPDVLPEVPGLHADAWLVGEAEASPGKAAFCRSNALSYHVIPDEALRGFPAPALAPASPFAPGRKKAIVTGCYDWLHSGHVRFFEEVSELGDLYVAVGNDANVRNLKGEGHPLFPQEERLYMVQAIRYVTQAMPTSGWGWMDAEPEIAWLKPEIYAVNEDGDKPEKREFCAQHEMEYVVLKRLPKEGLPRRQSTDLRGF